MDMGRFLCTIALAALMLCAQFALAESAGRTPLRAGSTFVFGHYEQDGNTANGEEPIEWIVLQDDGERALLLSRYALDCQPYHTEKADVTWAGCTLRTWLNGAFLESAFTAVERQAIVTDSIPNDRSNGNVQWTTDGGGTTRDSVFLLSYNELGVLFSAKDDRKADSTAYAHNLRYPSVMSLIGNGITWWLRSPGRNQSEGCFVNTQGAFDSQPVTSKAGVRPAIYLDRTVDRAAFPYERHVKADALQAQGRYADAADIFEELGTYDGSAALAVECRYLQAIQHADRGEYSEATALFEALGGYEDSDARGRESRYQDGVAHQQARDYEAAAALFGELGHYKDSLKRMRECFSQRGVSIQYLPSDPVNAGLDTGYAKSDVIDSGDAHFGWKLGQFFMSGFTRVQNAGSDCPVFIKTLGDSVTLWFEPSQDIDSLNGNPQLKIASDKDGYDQYFGIPKSDFGRGMLIVRHTDYQNAKGEPEIYRDFLAASGTYGADTYIELNEEGDYEVALNYEIEDDNIWHVANKYSNYRIFFRFSIRNGNCMVYPFDAVTGAELQNTSVTPNGFTLDLARSRYLDIDVERAVYLDTGVKDVRFNRPAKDGDRYTQEGVYTITVRNRYTGESTVKTIFVGPDELLETYVERGFSRESLN